MSLETKIAKYFELRQQIEELENQKKALVLCNKNFDGYFEVKASRFGDCKGGVILNAI